MKPFTIFGILLLISSVLASAQTPSWQWAKNTSGHFAEGRGIVCDPHGNIFVAGRFHGAYFNIGGVELLNPYYGSSYYGPEGDAVFIAKYDPCSNLVWAKGIDGSVDIYNFSIALDKYSNLFITGVLRAMFESTIYFDSVLLTMGTLDSSDMYIAKLDSNGNVLWAKNAIGAGQGNGICVDADGNSYVTGYFSHSTIKFDSITLSTFGSEDIFIVKYDPSGRVIWAEKGGGDQREYGCAIVADKDNNIFVTGGFQSDTARFDSITIVKTDSGAQAVFTAKYDSAGNILWVRQAGGDLYGYEIDGYASIYGSGIALDMSGNPIITGGFSTNFLRFGTTVLYHAPGGTNVNDDFFLAKYNSSGDLLWAKQAGGTDEDYGMSVACDSNSNIYVTGDFWSPSIYFDTFYLVNNGYAALGNGNPNLFVVKYDTAGSVVWAQYPGGTPNNDGNALTIDVFGNLYLTGDYSDTLTIFGTDSLRIDTAAYYSAFTAKYGFPYTGTCTEDMRNIVFENYVNVYPNPVFNEVFITSSISIIEVDVYNMYGQIVKSEKYNTEHIQMDFSSLPAGMFVINIRKSNGVIENRKIIKY